MREGGVDGGLGHGLRDLGQDGVEGQVLARNRKAIVHLHAGRVRGESVLVTERCDIGVAVGADQDAVRPPLGDGLEAFRGVLIVDDAPGGKVLLQEYVVVRVARIDRDRNPVLVREVALVFLTYDRGHLRGHQGRGDVDTEGLAVVGGEVGGEHAVHLTAAEGLDGIGGGGVCDGLELKLCVLHASRRKLQIVPERAGQLMGLRVRAAEGHVVVLVAHPNRPVLFDPLPF